MKNKQAVFPRRSDTSQMMGEVSNKTSPTLKCLGIEIFDHFFIGQCERPLRTEKEAFYHLPFVNICFRSRDMSFQSHKNLEEKLEKKIEHFVPLYPEL